MLCKGESIRPSKRDRAEEIIHKIREVEAALAQGKSTAEVCNKLGVAEQTYCRWRREYGGLKFDQPKSSKSLTDRTLGSNDFSRRRNLD